MGNVLSTGLMAGWLLSAAGLLPFLLQAVPAQGQLQTAAASPEQTVHAGQGEKSSGKVDFLQFRSVNGLTLQDDLHSVFLKKGKPLFTETDPASRKVVSLVYGDTRVRFEDGYIQAIDVNANASVIDIDGELFPMDKNTLLQLLGPPYFIAEDGIVYVHQERALKLYVEPDTGKLTEIHLFFAGGV